MTVRVGTKSKPNFLSRAVGTVLQVTSLKPGSPGFNREVGRAQVQVFRGRNVGASAKQVTSIQAGLGVVDGGVATAKAVPGLARVVYDVSPVNRRVDPAGHQKASERVVDGVAIAVTHPKDTVGAIVDPYVSAYETGGVGRAAGRIGFDVAGLKGAGSVKGAIPAVERAAQAGTRATNRASRSIAVDQALGGQRLRSGGPTLFAGAGAPIEVVEQMLASARRKVNMHAFILHGTSARSLRDASEAAGGKLKVRALLDKQRAETGEVELPVGARTATYGEKAPEGPNYRNHAKVVVVDGRAAMTTAGLADKSRSTYEVTALFDEPATVKRLDRWVTATRSGSPRRMRATARALERDEIYSNNPAAGSRRRDAYRLSQRIGKAIVRARPGETIHVITKNFDPNRVEKKLAHARARGVDVIQLDDRQAAALGVHGNLMVTEREAYFGSAYFSKGAIDGKKKGRRSLEVGMVTEDPAQVAYLRDQAKLWIAAGNAISLKGASERLVLSIDDLPPLREKVVVSFER